MEKKCLSGAFRQSWEAVRPGDHNPPLGLCATFRSGISGNGGSHVASTILLQQPHSKADCKEHVRALERCMQAWKEGDIEGLLREGRTIQDQLRQFISVKNHTEKSSQAASAFAKLVMQGKIRAAHRFLSEGEGGRILDLTRW